MIARVRSRLTYANVVATIALFAALGGSAVAAGVFDGHRIKGRSVPGTKLIRNSLTKNEVKESALGKVPNADKIDSLDSKDFLRANAQAVDAAKFGGRDLEEFLRKDSAGRAFDSSQLGGLGPVGVQADLPRGAAADVRAVLRDRACDPPPSFADRLRHLRRRPVDACRRSRSSRARASSRGFDLTTDAPGEWSADPGSRRPTRRGGRSRTTGRTSQTVATDAGTQSRCVFTPSG